MAILILMATMYCKLFKKEVWVYTVVVSGFGSMNDQTTVCTFFSFNMAQDVANHINGCVYNLLISYKTNDER